MKIGIFFGSTTGSTAAAADLIKNDLSSLGEVNVINIADSSPAAMNDYDFVILGVSTWGFGEMQDDWVGNESLDGANLQGKKVALYGLGDQSGFGDTFLDAMGILADAAETAGGTIIGHWPTEGYDFGGSTAVRDGKFVGLALDDDNQSNLTAERVTQWTILLQNELK